MIYKKKKKLLKIILLLCLLKAHNSIRCHPKTNLLTSAVRGHGLSRWELLYRNGNEQSFLSVTKFTYASFDNLYDYLSQFEVTRAARTGRPSSLSFKAKLGLTILYLTSGSILNTYAMIFGIAPSLVSKYIDEMLRILCSIFLNHPLAKIVWPNNEKKRQFSSMVQRRQQDVHNVIGFVDGLSLPVQCGEDEAHQSLFYNGHTKQTCINNVFAFGPDGTIFFASINFPGSWHDSHVSRDFYMTVLNHIGDYAICCDQGFTRSGLFKNKLVGPLSTRARNQMNINDVPAEVLEHHRAHVSLRQSAEWGMRCLQSVFTRLKTKLTPDPKKRADLLLAIVLLHNYRTNTVQINQIRTVFGDNYIGSINAGGNQRLERYFRFNRDE